MQKFKEKLLYYIKINTFRKKLLFTIIVCTAIPFLFSMGHIIYTSLDVVKKQTIQSEEYNLDLANLTMSNEIDYMIQTMNYIHFDDEIRSTLNASSRGTSIPPRAYSTINSRIDQLTRNSNVAIAVIPVTGEHYLSNYHFNGKFEFAELDHLFEKLEKVSTFQVLGFNAADIDEGRKEGHLLDTNDQTILLGKRLTSYSGKTTAYIFAGLKDLKNIEMDNQSKHDRSLLLLDENGYILYDQNRGNIGEKFQYFHRLEDGQNSKIISHDGEDYLYVHQQVPFQEWTLLSYMPYHDAIDELSNAYTFNIYINTFALFILIMILLYIVNRFTQPITTLASIAKEIETGNLQIRSNISRNDEIGRLSLAFDLMLDRIQDMFEKLKTEQEIKRKAEVAILQGKIKPHFIFNVLNTIRIQAYKNGDKETSHLIMSFNKFLRMIYKGQEWITFEEEMNHSKNYLHLMNAMRKIPVSLYVDLDPETLDINVPRFFIQPIVENSLKHGIKNGNGEIFIAAEIERAEMIVTIKDDGNGLEVNDLMRVQDSLRVSKDSVIANYDEENEHMGIGLKNINERMILIYGEDFTMEVKSMWQQGMTVTFRIPLKGGRE
ncbi:hypothetical protein CR203_13905 [Salipaludibacillus neizhouensis]|uniref:HAMP domain-containing protein n=1 Tax=Salipaludibacillus neizhouensis TaxID=885475 RepID=A0A3A9K3K9_9BACI|nr:histidine kinase [Salipaludibacillus neizhouensis]RKL66919.1 hypothetical protein CR203_13905 [Salipaludibacillus neizhouensis]